MDSALDAIIRLVQLLVSAATLATLVWGLAKMFSSAAEAKATRAEAVAASVRAERAARAASDNAAVAASEVRSMSENVQKIELATNSMKDALVLATATSSKLEGREEMRVEQAAEKAKG